jgi:hypothetical protein
MSIKKFLSCSSVILALFVFAGTAAAQTATVPHLTVNATVANALRLDISSSVGGVTGTGTSSDFVVDLGNINALGIGPPATGVTVSVTAGAGAAGFAIYTTPIVLTPVFSGFGAGTANIALTIGGGANDATAVEGDSNALATLAAARVVVPSSLSDVANTRHVGFKISKTEANGPRTAIFLYTITMP